MTPEDAFNEFATYLPRYLTFGSPDQVEDAVSETFVHILARPELLTKASPLSVLIRVARCKLLDIIRSTDARNKRERVYARPEALNRTEPLTFQDLPLKSLSNRQRAILQLRAEGYDHVEIGERLNMKPKTVSRAQIIAIETLKGCVA